MRDEIADKMCPAVVDSHWSPLLVSQLVWYTLRTALVPSTNLSNDWGCVILLFFSRRRDSRREKRVVVVIALDDPTTDLHGELVSINRSRKNYLSMNNLTVNKDFTTVNWYLSRNHE